MRSREGLTQLTQGGGRREWLLARSLCAYTTLAAEGVPSRKRARFAEMAVARWSPFADTQSHVEWIGDRGMVWAWSKPAILTDAEGEALPPPSRILPESLFRGSAQADGEELVETDDGLEGRVWRDGYLSASGWWPAVPALEAWNEFRRGAGLPPAAAVPLAVRHSLSPSPWGAASAPGLGQLMGQQRLLLSALAVGVAVAAIMATLVGALALQVSVWQVNDDIAAREKAIAPILDAREAAIADAGKVDALLAMRPPQSQTQMLASMARLIPGTWQLLKWDMPDANHLQLTLRMDAADPRRIVEAWERSGSFSEVTAEIVRQPDQVLVKARILRAPMAGAAK